MDGPKLAQGRRLRLAAVINWRDLGRWLWGYLPDADYQADLVFAAPEGGAGRGRRLPPYLREFWHLARRRTDFDRFDVVFAWELRATLAALLWRWLTGRRRARFVAVAPIFKGPAARAALLMRPLLAGVDRFVCFSRAECGAYAALLRLPPERFLFHPLATRADAVETPRDDNFVLALGHSNRDYLTLLEAARDTDIPLTIISADDRWHRGREVPPNVTLRCATGVRETDALVEGATFHVIPLNDAGYSSGQSVLLWAMACSKAVVVSDIPGVRDYVRDGETARLVPVGDPASLRREMLRLWRDPAERDRLGRSAARAVREEFSFSALAQFLAALAGELVPGGESSKVKP